MAIALRAVGTWAAGTANQTFTIPASPSTPQAGDLMLLFYGTKPYNDAPTINNGWASLGSASDGTVAAGIDVGSMQARIFWKEHTGTETNPTVTNTTNNVSGGVIIVFSKASTARWNIEHGGAGDSTAGTGFSATTAGNITFAPGDLVAAFAALRSDAATQSSISVSASGITFGTFTESPATDLADASGGDIAASGGYAPVNSGTATTTLTYASTLAAAHTGSFYAARLRELPAQTLSPSLVSESTTLYAPTVTVGAVTLSPSLVNLGNTVYNPTIINRQILEPSLLTDGDTVYNVTVTTGAVTLSPSLVTDGDTIYEPTVSQATPAQTLTPSLVSDGDTLYAPTVTTGAVTLSPTLVTNSQTFYGATVSVGAVTLSPTLLSDGDTVYNPTITTGAVSLTPSLLTNSSSFFNATVSQGGGGTQNLGAAFIDSTGNIFVPLVSVGAVTLTPSLLTNSNAFYSPVITTGGVSIVAPLLTNTSSIYSPTIGMGTATKVYTSAGWVTCTVKAWNGKEWTGQLKVYNGGWIDL